MHKVENKSKEEIAKIGRKIGEAFAAEKAGIVTLLTEEQTVKAFEIMTEYFYRAGVLYSTSETGEGYLAYWEKKTKPAIGPALHMIKRFLCELPLKAGLAVIMDVEPYSKTEGVRYHFHRGPIAEFAKEHGYLDIMPAICNSDYPAMDVINGALIRRHTCANSNICDYWIVGDQSDIAKEHPRKTDEKGYWYNH